MRERVVPASDAVLRLCQRSERVGQAPQLGALAGPSDHGRQILDRTLQVAPPRFEVAAGRQQLGFERLRAHPPRRDAVKHSDRFPPLANEREAPG